MSDHMEGTGWEKNERIRYYGEKGPTVILLHGGPAGYGDLGDMAEGLQDSFQVIEPWQRPSGDIPLTVEQHVEDLHGLIQLKCPRKKPAIIGHSWGAMLALIYGSTYPRDCGPVVLVGCGTFDFESHAQMKHIFNERLTDEERKIVDEISDNIEDDGERLIEKYKIIGKLQEYEHIPREKTDMGEFDSRGHQETWGDMVRLRDEEIYPEAFSSIKSPVMMLHGKYDPHPGHMIYQNLKWHIPQLKYHEWEKCGHYPWREKYAKDNFFSFLHGWLWGQFGK